MLHHSGIAGLAAERPEHTRIGLGVLIAEPSRLHRGPGGDEERYNVIVGIVRRGILLLLLPPVKGPTERGPAKPLIFHVNRRAALQERLHCIQMSTVRCPVQACLTMWTREELAHVDAMVKKVLDDGLSDRTRKPT